jgi:photosystem II stability/assembly factor-like uncharacterized protein
MKHQLVLLFLFSISSLPIRAQDFWQQTSGPLSGGSINFVAADGTTNSAFVAAYNVPTSSTLWRTTDNGTSWLNVTGTITNLARSILTKNNGEVFVGTSGGGVFRSTNNGLTWSQTGFTLTHEVGSLASNNLGHLFAGTNTAGMFRSTDDGNTWQQKNAGLLGLYAGSITIDGSGDIFIVAAQGRVFKSTNNGDSWNQLSGGIENQSVVTVAINSFGWVFASTSNVLYRSTDGGTTWVQIPRPGSFLWLAVSPSDRIFAGTQNQGLFFSTDNGNSWNPTSITNTDIRSIAFAASNVVYAGGPWGLLFRSTDNGASWLEVASGWQFARVRALTIDQQSRVYAGCYSGTYGVYQTSNPFVSWTRIGTTALNLSRSILLRLPTIFVGTEGDGLYRSTDAGATWSTLGPISSWVYSLAVTTAGNILAGTGGGVFRSTDNGSNWSAANSGLTDTQVFSLVTSNLGQTFAGTASGVFYSTNDGTNWTPRNTGITNTIVNALAITSQAIFAGTNAGVFRSTDNGTNWSSSNSGLTNTTIYSIQQNSIGHLFVGTAGGVFRSTDDGANWTEINSGLSNFTVRTLAIDQSGMLYAGTEGAGVFRSAQPTTSVNFDDIATPESFRLRQNYPNPFNPQTTISFSIPRSTYTTLTIFNTLAQEIVTLVSDNLNPGTYSAEWNASNAASGVYYYRLQAGEFTQTKKLILMK